MRQTDNIIITKVFSENYKCIHLTIWLYGIHCAYGDGCEALDWLSQSTQMHYNLIDACNVLHPNIIMQKFMINKDFLFENIDK